MVTFQNTHGKSMRSGIDMDTKTRPDLSNVNKTVTAVFLFYLW